MTRTTEKQIEQAVDKLFARSAPAADLRPWRLEVAKAEVCRFVEVREALKDARGLS